jgi:hypothetical protein
MMARESLDINVDDPPPQLPIEYVSIALLQALS